MSPDVIGVTLDAGMLFAGATKMRTDCFCK